MQSSNFEHGGDHASRHPQKNKASALAGAGFVSGPIRRGEERLDYMQYSHPHVFEFEAQFEISLARTPLVLMHAVFSRLLSGLYTLL